LVVILTAAASPRSVGIDLVSQRGPHSPAAFFLILARGSSLGAGWFVPDEEHPSELRYLGKVGVICFGDELRLNLNCAPNRLCRKRLKATVGLTERADNRRKSVGTGILILSDVLKLSTHERLLLANRIHKLCVNSLQEQTGEKSKLTLMSALVQSA
jgi:hypothetical protein